MRFIWPVADHVITRDFHYLSSLYVGGQHAAVDLIPKGRPATGEPVRAIADWTAVGVGWDYYSGFFVALDHAGGWRSFYRHLYGQSPVKVGQQGKQGDIVGNVGNTGYSLGAHLHFDLWNCIQFFDSMAFYKNGWWAHNPELYLGQEDDDMALTAEQNATLKSIPGLLEHLHAHHQANRDRLIGIRTRVDACHNLLAGLGSDGSGAGPTDAQLEAVIIRVLERQKTIVMD